MIYVDLDNTVFDANPVLLGHVARALGVPAPAQAVGAYDLALAFPPEHRQAAARQLPATLADPEVYRAMTPFEGAVAALWRWHERGLLGSFVTQRPASDGVVEATLDALERHGLPPTPVVFTPDKRAFLANGGHFLLHIDDSPAVVADLREAGLLTLVYAQPYNAHLGAPRAADWAAVEQYVEHLLYARQQELERVGA